MRDMRDRWGWSSARSVITLSTAKGLKRKQTCDKGSHRVEILVGKAQLLKVLAIRGRHLQNEMINVSVRLLVRGQTHSLHGLGVPITKQTKRLSG
jgi:hypothetical protein